MRGLFFIACALFAAHASASSAPGDYIVKVKPGRALMFMQQSQLALDGDRLEDLGNDWLRVQGVDVATNALRSNPDIEYVQPNYRLKLIEDYKTSNRALRKTLEALSRGETISALMPQDMFGGANMFASLGTMASDGGWLSPSKPEFVAASIIPDYGPDPLLKYQWGMHAIHADEAWRTNTGNKNIVVAVIDSGVDYTHPDLVGNIWHNPNEIPANQIDDD